MTNNALCPICGGPSEFEDPPPWFDCQDPIPSTCWKCENKMEAEADNERLQELCVAAARSGRMDLI